MKHLFFILDYYLPHHWGIETVFEQIISRLLKKWYRITLLTSRFDHTLPEYEHNGKFSVYRVASWRLSFLFSSLLKWFHILRTHKDIEVIHASTYGSAIQSSILGKIFHKKVILTVHEVFWKLWYTYKWWFRGFVYSLFEQLLFFFPYDAYHCVSRYTMNSLRLVYGIADSKLFHIYNGVDYDFWNKNKVSSDDIQDLKREYNWQNKFVCLYYGHAWNSKWIDYLIDAIPLVLKQSHEFLFVFNVIDSKRKSSMIHRLEHLKKYGYKHQIQIFYGMDKIDLRILLASSDVVIAPSLSEWFWSVHSEVSAMEKPLITTFIASIPEVVSGKVSFITPRSSQQIADAILLHKENQNIKDIPVPYVFDRNLTVDQIEQLY